MASPAIVITVSGLLALACSAALIAPASRGVVATLRALIDAARRADPALFASRIEPGSPFRGERFIHRNITAALRADFAPFGAECQRLQAEARSFDRRAHYGLLPVGAFVLAFLLWYALRR